MRTIIGVKNFDEVMNRSAERAAKLGSGKNVRT